MHLPIDPLKPQKFSTLNGLQYMVYDYTNGFYKYCKHFISFSYSSMVKQIIMHLNIPIIMNFKSKIHTCLRMVKLYGGLVKPKCQSFYNKTMMPLDQPCKNQLCEHKLHENVYFG